MAHHSILPSQDLHSAALDNNTELLSVLLAVPGVDVNLQDNLGRTPLMVACREGQVECVQRLVEVEGLDVNRRDIVGWTALHLAVTWNHPLCVEALSSVETLDWRMTDGGGQSPLSIAAHLGHADCLELILSLPVERLHGEGEDPAWLAVENTSRGDPVRCLELLSQDTRLEWNVRDRAGDTPLMFCVKNNKMEMAKVLLNSPSVNPHIPDRDGKFIENIARS